MLHVEYKKVLSNLEVIETIITIWDIQDVVQDWFARGFYKDVKALKKHCKFYYELVLLGTSNCMMNFQTFDQKLHDCDKIGYFNDKFDVDENQQDLEIRESCSCC